ncbi:MAG: hypothetical protein ACI808_000535 [Paraglaciecola sp.]|jgi:hypothetical protein
MNNRNTAVPMFSKAAHQKLITQVLMLMTVLSFFALLPVVHAEEEWTYKLSPYMWFAGSEGHTGFIGDTTVPVDLSASDALKDTSSSLMLMFDAKKQRHGVLVDLLYSDVRSDEGLMPITGNPVKSITKTTVFSLAYQYEVYKKNQTVVDVFAGIRYWSMDSEIQFGNYGQRKVTNDETWIDPLLGVKARAAFGSSDFYVAGGLGLGGFGMGSDLFYDTNINVGYQWTPSIGTTIGYRLYDLDYENDGFSHDATNQGWQLGLTWRL